MRRPASLTSGAPTTALWLTVVTLNAKLVDEWKGGLALLYLAKRARSRDVALAPLHVGLQHLP